MSQRVRPTHRRLNFRRTETRLTDDIDLLQSNRHGARRKLPLIHSQHRAKTQPDGIREEQLRRQRDGRSAGEASSLDSFVEELKKGPGPAKVSRVSTEKVGVKEGDRGFEQ